jgi:hypothetical protein
LGDVIAQSQDGRKMRTNPKGIVEKTSVPSEARARNKDEMENDRIEKEDRFRSSVRYVIVYNDIVEVTENRMVDVLISEKQYSKENLIKIFDLIKKRFPLPIYLSINVHTSLATIETPEEREMENYGDRFLDEIYTHKTADYDRLADGSEGFHYVVSLVPYREKIVLLSKAAK